MHTPETALHIRIGTRGSKLALWQAYYISDRLKAHGHTAEIVTIETKGDIILDRTLAKVGSKGIFTEEIEDQLRQGTIDIAVHSAKDLQSELHEDFEILAFTEREKMHDVLVSFQPDLAWQDTPIYIGTSSVRRTAMFAKYLPHASVANVRGNLQTRLRKLEEGNFHALALAYAGVHRMGYDHLIVAHLPTDSFIPPVGQGTVAVEISRSMPEAVKAVLKAVLNHPETEYALKAERAFLRKLQGGCSIPAFALAQLPNAQKLLITGGIISTDGKREVKTSLESTPEKAEQLGTQLAEQVLQQGGDEILRQIRRDQKN